MKMRRKRGISFILMLVLLVSGFGFMPKKVWAFPGDDYPVRWKNVPIDTREFDNNRMFLRQCTSFAAWCLETRNGFSLLNNGLAGTNLGHAKDWGTNAAARGYRVDNNPAVGSIAWSKAWVGGAYEYGHVAWVEAVNGDNVVIQEYNFASPGNYGRRVINRWKVSGYIHFKDISGSSPSSTPQADPIDIGDRFYAYIVNKHTGRYLTKTDEFYVTTTPDLRGERSLWWFYKIRGNWYRIQSEHDDNFLDVSWGIAKQGQRIQTYKDNGADNKAQMWGVYRSKENAYLQSALSGAFTLDENPDTHKVWMWDHHALGAQSFSIHVVNKTSVVIDTYPMDGADLTFTAYNLLPDVTYKAYISGPRSYEVSLSSSNGQASKTISLPDSGSYRIKVKSTMEDVKQESEEKSFAVTKKEIIRNDSFSSSNSNDTGTRTESTPTETENSNQRTDENGKNENQTEPSETQREELDINTVLSNVKFLDYKSTNEKRKTWTIRFNQEIQTLNQDLIYLLDMNGRVMKASKLRSGSDKLMVIPLEDLGAKTVYYVYIKKEAINGNKGRMSTNYIFPFSIIDEN